MIKNTAEEQVVVEANELPDDVRESFPIEKDS